ncbi:hypothetical protein G6F68_017183 [Rhizopus microsporus]|nr:hypothetical protein G6F68_017183 [Rhizopus microsporus]
MRLEHANTRPEIQKANVTRCTGLGCKQETRTVLHVSGPNDACHDRTHQAQDEQDGKGHKDLQRRLDESERESVKAYLFVHLSIDLTSLAGRVTRIQNDLCVGAGEQDDGDRPVCVSNDVSPTPDRGDIDRCLAVL